MNLLFRVLYAQKCTSTHHMLAMDALRYLRCDKADLWASVFLADVQQYMDGAKAPDSKFKDFRNHVLHVADHDWGGAVTASQTWYERLLEQLRLQDWSRAVYCAGVLSHYLTDPLMPLHTGQTEDEGQVHKFIEWGTAGIYRELVSTIPAARALQNWKPPETSASEDWLALLVKAGAVRAHEHYDIMIDHYDPVTGHQNPRAGFDSICRDSLSTLLGCAIRSLAFVLDQAITVSQAVPPRRNLTVATVLSGLSTPLFWVTRKLADQADRKQVQAIWEELQATGKVIDQLPADEKAVRAAHAEEVLGVPVDELDRVPIRKAGTRFVSESDAVVLPMPSRTPSVPAVRFYLELDSPVVDAPSIGPKTAARLHRIEIHTVEQLIDANVDDATDQLDESWITADLFRSWQQQSVLMCRVPGLRGHDAQLLVAVGITRPEELHDADDADLLHRIQQYANTTEGKRVLRSASAPDLAEIARWKQFTEHARKLRAA
ncbi:MAG: DUF4332 domain-containing protein [Planctomycetaceae bacterium]